MSTQHADPPFTVSVHAGFTEDGVWSIDARLLFRDGRTPPVGSRLLGEGRIALFKAIHHEVLRGDSLRANRIYLHMDAGDGPVDISPGGVVPEIGPTN